MEFSFDSHTLYPLQSKELVLLSPRQKLEWQNATMFSLYIRKSVCCFTRSSTREILSKKGRRRCQKLLELSTTVGFFQQQREKSMNDLTGWWKMSSFLLMVYRRLARDRRSTTELQSEGTPTYSNRRGLCTIFSNGRHAWALASKSNEGRCQCSGRTTSLSIVVRCSSSSSERWAKRFVFNAEFASADRNDLDALIEAFHLFTCLHINEWASSSSSLWHIFKRTNDEKRREMNSSTWKCLSEVLARFSVIYGFFFVFQLIHFGGEEGITFVSLLSDQYRKAWVTQLAQNITFDDARLTTNIFVKREKSVMHDELASVNWLKPIRIGNDPVE